MPHDAQAAFVNFMGCLQSGQVALDISISCLRKVDILNADIKNVKSVFHLLSVTI